MAFEVVHCTRLVPSLQLLGLSDFGEALAGSQGMREDLKPSPAFFLRESPKPVHSQNGHSVARADRGLFVGENASLRPFCLGPASASPGFRRWTPNGEPPVGPRSSGTRVFAG